MRGIDVRKFVLLVKTAVACKEINRKKPSEQETELKPTTDFVKCVKTSKLGMVLSLVRDL